MKGVEENRPSLKTGGNGRHVEKPVLLRIAYILDRGGERSRVSRRHRKKKKGAPVVLATRAARGRKSENGAAEEGIQRRVKECSSTREGYEREGKDKAGLSPPSLRRKSSYCILQRT